jgi:3-hydroxyacyl-[acyl-carrier-protein] dehydratase
MDDPLARALGCLPHGVEFRFVDRLLSLDPGKQGVGEYRVRGDEPFLRGHFPGEPLFPGVLIVEACAQLAGVVAQSDSLIPPLQGLKLASVRSVKLTGTARPGEIIQLEARLTGRLANLIQAEATARVHGHLVMRGELTLSGDAPRAESR